MAGGGPTSTLPASRYVSSRTRRETEERLTKAKADRNAGLVFELGTVFLDKYLKRWLEDIQDTVSPRTWERYEQNVRLHIVPELGCMKLASLTAANVRGLLQQKRASGLAPRRVHYVHQTLHKALKQAATDGLLARNVAEFVKAPRPAKNEIRYLDSDQVHAFLGAAKGDRLEDLYVLAITTGMRQGELLALRWEDVNLERRTLQVRRTLAAIKDGVAVYKSPKSGRGRNIKLSGTAVEALCHHRNAQGEERTWAGDRWEDHGLVFSDAFGKPLRRWTLGRRSFKPLLERAGLSGAITFHGLRHPHAGRGVHVKVVQEMLGHADVALTLNVHSHVLPNLQDEAERRIDELLS